MFVEFIYELRAFGRCPWAPRRRCPREASRRGCTSLARRLLPRGPRALRALRDPPRRLRPGVRLKHFKGVQVEAKKLTDELSGVAEGRPRSGASSRTRSAPCWRQLDLEELKRMFEERLKEQTERHDGGNRWIGTGGTSPFGHAGENPKGIRVGGPGGKRSAVKVADARQVQAATARTSRWTCGRCRWPCASCAPSRARAPKRSWTSRGPSTRPRRTPASSRSSCARRAAQHPRHPDDGRGRLHGPLRAPRLAALLRGQARSTHWKELRTYYFHNCVYGKVYKTD
jgi:hypothetical protein